MRFDTTHEYYLDDPQLYYCEDHSSLIVHTSSNFVDNRLVLSGISKDVIDNLIKNYKVKRTPKSTAPKSTSKE